MRKRSRISSSTRSLYLRVVILEGDKQVFDLGVQVVKSSEGEEDAVVSRVFAGAEGLLALIENADHGIKPESLP